VEVSILANKLEGGCGERQGREAGTGLGIDCNVPLSSLRLCRGCRRGMKDLKERGDCCCGSQWQVNKIHEGCSGRLEEARLG
jgi:hypothetical protein